MTGLPPSLRRRLLSSLLAVTVVVMGLSALETAGAPQAAAADASQFKAGNIISDETFFSSAAMNSSQIQSFLNSKVTSCPAGNGQPCLKDYRQTTSSRAATSLCNSYSGAASESAAQIIQKVAAACGINPQVLLVLLEKEQGLVSATSPTERQYRVAMGYGCPDTADCDTAYYGFFNQVYSSASQFQRYTKTSSSWSYQPGRVNNILWSPNTACGSSPVYIENQATANLYIYTPYQPNAAALANLYGSGDSCSAYGNRNFWRIFSDWFGSPTDGQLKSPSFEGGSVYGWGASNGFINQAVYRDPSLAQNGEWFLATNTSVSARAMTQDVKRPTNDGDQVTTKVWLRSASSKPFNGVVAVWGLGGTTEQASTSFTVTNTWTEVTVKLPVRQGSHNVVRLDIYMLSTDGTLWIDNASMAFGAAPPVQNLIKQQSFEGSFGSWAPGNGFMNQQIYQDASIAQSGSWFAATNTAVAGRSLAQVIPATTSAGDRFTFRIWVRAADGSKPFTGRLALWGLGSGRQTVNTTDFTTSGTTWQEVSVTLDINQSQLDTLKPEVYLTSTNNTLFVDNAMLGKNLLTASSFEGPSFAGWGAGAGSPNYAVYANDPNPNGIHAAHGGYFAATNSASSGSSLAQVVARETSTGDFYTAEVWLRSADAGKTYSGTLAVWALGGTTEVAAQPFSVGGEWQKVRVQLPVSKADHTQLKFEIYLGSTDNTLFVDGANFY